MDASSFSDRRVEQVSSVSPTVPSLPAAGSAGPGGGLDQAPAARSGWRAILEPVKRSPWLPVVTRSAAIVLGMLALAGIGVASTLAGAGVSVPVPSGSPAPSLSGVWLAPDNPSGAAGAAAKGARAGTGIAPLPDAGTRADDDASKSKSPSGAGLTPDGKIVLNVASAEELMKLPRVGAKRAQAILELRRKLGRFQRPTDLLRVRGIGRKTLKLMLPMLVLDPPAG